MNPADAFGLVGQVIDGQLQIDRVVGEGERSVVYRGQHLGLKEPVAVKCLKLPPTLGQGIVEKFSKRFRDETRVLTRLAQGNAGIARTISAGTTFSPATGLLVPYLSLEWLDGRSLAADLRERRRRGQKGRSLTEAVRLLAPVVDAVGFAHRQGTVHRDLHPGNIFFAKTSRGEKAKVLDFGVAKVLHQVMAIATSGSYTLEELPVFSPAYGAPEQFDEALGAASAATDVYALTLILLEVMRDAPVNEGIHFPDFMRLALDPSHRPTPRSLGIDVPDDVEKVFARAISRDPRARWQNAGELWGALTFALEVKSAKKSAPLPAPKPAPSSGRTLGGGLPKVPQIRPILKAPAPRATRGLTPPPPRATPAPPRYTPPPPRATPAPPRVTPAPPPRLGPIDSEEDIDTRVGMILPFEHEPEGERDDEVTRVERDIERPSSRPVDRPVERPRPPPIEAPEDGGTLVMASPLAQLQQAQKAAAAHSPQPPPVSLPSPSQPPPPAAYPPHFQRAAPPMTPGPPPVALAPAYAGAVPAAAAGEPLGVRPLVALGLAAAALFVSLVVLGGFAFSGKGDKEETTATEDPAASASPVDSAAPTPPPTPPPARVHAEMRDAAVEAAAASTDAADASDDEAAEAAVAPATTAPSGTPLVEADASAVVPDVQRDAREKLGQATASLEACKRPGGKSGPGSASVTFGSEGAVINIQLDPPYSWGPEGECVAQQIRRVKLDPSKDLPLTLKHSFVVPE